MSSLSCAICDDDRDDIDLVMIKWYDLNPEDSDYVTEIIICKGCLKEGFDLRSLPLRGNVVLINSDD